MIIIPKQLKNHRFIKTREKIPIELGWVKDRNYSLEDASFLEYLKHNTTYGVLCGFNNLLVIDLDNPDIQTSLMAKYEIFNQTFTVKSAGKGLFHFYFYTDIVPESFKCLDSNFETLIDAQGRGKQIIGAGSTLANGRQYEVVNDTKILEVKYSTIKEILLAYNSQGEKKEPLKQIGRDELIEEIKKEMPVSKLLNIFGINTKKNPTECPFHNSVGGKCLSFTDTLWHCFHCNKSGDIFNLYMDYTKCDFLTAKTYLFGFSGLEKKQMSQGKKLWFREKQQKHQEQNQKALKGFNELNIKKFIIYKSKDETIYKIQIGDFFITLIPETILGSAEFRRKYFNETGNLLKSIDATDWVDLVNKWVEDYGQIIDQINEANSESLIVETIINDIQNFAAVTEPIEAISYGRVLFYKEEPQVVYVCNRVLDTILKKNQFKLTMSKLKVLLDDYISGNSKVIRTGTILSRFFRFKLELLPNIDVEGIGNEKD